MTFALALLATPLASAQFEFRTRIQLDARSLLFEDESRVRVTLVHKDGRTLDVVSESLVAIENLGDGEIDHRHYVTRAEANDWRPNHVRRILVRYEIDGRVIRPESWTLESMHLNVESSPLEPFNMVSALAPAWVPNGGPGVTFDAGSRELQFVNLRFRDDPRGRFEPFTRVNLDITNGGDGLRHDSTATFEVELVSGQILRHDVSDLPGGAAHSMEIGLPTGLERSDIHRWRLWFRRNTGERTWPDAEDNWEIAGGSAAVKNPTETWAGFGAFGANKFEDVGALETADFAPKQLPYRGARQFLLGFTTGEHGIDVRRNTGTWMVPVVRLVHHDGTATRLEINAGELDAAADGFRPYHEAQVLAVAPRWVDLSTVRAIAIKIVQRRGPFAHPWDGPQKWDLAMLTVAGAAPHAVAPDPGQTLSSREEVEGYDPHPGWFRIHTQANDQVIEGVDGYDRVEGLGWISEGFEFRVPPIRIYELEDDQAAKLTLEIIRQESLDGKTLDYDLGDFQPSFGE